MPQIVRGIFGENRRQCLLPTPHTQVMPGIQWGRFDYLFTPAFWASQIWFNSERDFSHFRLGDTIEAEVAACLLGGYGIPAEIGLAAYDRIRGEGLIGEEGTEAALLGALSHPLRGAAGRPVRYRFARQKARYLAGSFQVLAKSHPPEDKGGKVFRDWLLRLPGIGLKTGSWITRNWLASDDVAIIDIHLYRAGRLAGFFPASSRVDRDYLLLEQRFLEFAKAINGRPSVLDAVIWEFMKQVGRVGIASYEELGDSKQELSSYKKGLAPHNRATKAEHIVVRSK